MFVSASLSLLDVFVFHVMGKALSDEVSCIQTGLIMKRVLFRATTYYFISKGKVLRLASSLGIKSIQANYTLQFSASKAFSSFLQFHKGPIKKGYSQKITRPLAATYGDLLNFSACKSALHSIRLIRWH